MESQELHFCGHDNSRADTVTKKYKKEINAEFFSKINVM